MDRPGGRGVTLAMGETDELNGVVLKGGVDTSGVWGTFHYPTNSKPRRAAAGQEARLDTAFS